MRKQVIKVAWVLACGVAALLAQATMTWDGTNWNTTWTGTSCTCDVTCLLDYQVVGGNPDNRRRSVCTGKADTPTGHHEWAGTWEDLGVTPGDVVSTVQLTDVDYRYITDTDCDDVDVGPFELRSSADALVATLWAGSGTLTTAGAYASAGSQTAQSVGSLTASNASIELWMQVILDTANVTGATCDSGFDNLDLAIVHSAPPATKANRLMIAQRRTRVRFADGRATSTTERVK